MAEPGNVPDNREEMFQSPLVKELFQLAGEVFIPRIQQLDGFPGGVIKHFVNQFLDQMPQAFAAMDGDLALQQEIMAQLRERFARLEPAMEEYFTQHAA